MDMNVIKDNELNKALKDQLHYSNIKELLQESFKLYSNNDFFGFECDMSLDKKKSLRSKKVISNREFHWRKYKEIYHDVLLLKNYIEDNEKMFLNDNDNKDGVVIVIYANKSYQMLITILALMLINTTTSANPILLPIYDMIPILQLNEILNQVKPSVLFTDSNSINNINTISDSIKTIIVYDNNNDDSSNITQGSYNGNKSFNNVSIVKYSELIHHYSNKDNDISNTPHSFNNTFQLLALTSIEYKLCCINSDQLLITINDLLTFDYFHYNQHDIYYQINSYADITEIVFLLILIQSGSRIVLCDNLTNFYSSIEILHPTIINTYPIIWKKIYMTLQQIIQSLNEEQHSIVSRAIKVRLKEENNNNRKGKVKDNKDEHNSNGNEGNDNGNGNELKDNIESNTSNRNIWDKLVFDKIKMKFGSKIRYLFTSNDTISNSITQFIELSLKAKMIQIYGTTETCGFIALRDNSSSFHLGDILPSKHISIAKCNTIGYYSYAFQLKEMKTKYIEELCGEIVVKGYGLYEGYYNQIEKGNTSYKDKYTFNTGDYGVLVIKNGSYESIEDKVNASRIVFIDKIDDFLYVYDKNKKLYMSPMMIETALNETFKGKISNLFISMKDHNKINDTNTELVIIGQVTNHCFINCNNPEKVRKELIEDISNYIKDHYYNTILMSIKEDQKECLIKNIYLIEKCEKLYTIKYKVNRKLLMKEVQFIASSLNK